MDKAAVFIDGGYLAKVLKDFGEPKIDFLRMSDFFCEKAGAERFRTYYYFCMPYQSPQPTQEERERYMRADKFINYLKKLPRFEVRLGKLGRRTYRCSNCGSSSIEYEQKRADNLLTVDLVGLSWRGVIQKAILLTGDSDFVPAVQEAKRADVLVTIWYARTRNCTIHDELYAECDERFELDKETIALLTLEPKTSSSSSDSGNWNSGEKRTYNR